MFVALAHCTDLLQRLARPGLQQDGTACNHTVPPDKASIPSSSPAAQFVPWLAQNNRDDRRLLEVFCRSRETFFRLAGSGW
ncbi:hypothetical protein VTH82DRAFT_8169 [Thermothelomyces myriococcoides]